MSLLQLPPEIILRILDFVGAAYFRENVQRLTVCKQWLALVQSIWLKDLRLTSKGLGQLLSIPNVNRSLNLIKTNCEELHVCLRGYDHGDTPRLPPRHTGEDPGVEASISVNDEQAIDNWTRKLNQNLIECASYIREAHKLRTLRIQAAIERHPELFSLPRRNYLRASAIQAFLSVDHLTTLELDLHGSDTIPQQENQDDTHICPSIAKLLGALRHLRLRMRSICPKVLQSQHLSGSTKLSKVLINLALFDLSATTSSVGVSTRCGDTGGGFLELRSDLEDQARALADQMVSPKLIKILTPTLASLEMESLDVLTGKRTKLSHDADWEDDGEPVDGESDIESDIPSISDSSSDQNE